MPDYDAIIDEALEDGVVVEIPRGYDPKDMVNRIQDISTSSTGGQKEVKDERMDLLPMETLRQVSRVYAFGTKKYAAHNWRKGYEWSKSEASLLRHLTAFMQGEDVDSETQEPHLSSVVFHALALLTWGNDPELKEKFDDRFKTK